MAKSSQQFKSKVVWITGGGSGIGEALAYEIARRGGTLVLSGRRVQKLEHVRDAIEAMGQQALAVGCDVTSEQDIARAVEEIIAQYGRLDVAVANAGFGVGGDFDSLTEEDWRRQFDVNVVGAAMTIKHALPQLKHHQGRAVFVGSVAGTVSGPGTSAYCASKYAIRSIAQSLSMELIGTGVSCTNIQPGFVESDIGIVDNEGVAHEDWTDRRPQAIMWSSERAARVIADAIHARKREFTFTGHGKVASFVGRHAPDLVYYGLKGYKMIKR